MLTRMRLVVIVALTAPVAALSAVSVMAASGTWTNPALTNTNGLLDAGVTFPGTADVRWVDAATATIEFPAQDGDIFRITGTIAGTGLAANTAFWVVNTPAPSNVFQLATTPGGTAIVHPGPVATPPNANRYFKWNDPANWDTIPNGVDDVATFTTPGAQTRVVLDGNITLGAITFDGNGPNDLDIYGGHISAPNTLTFAASSGTPTVRILGGIRPIGLVNNNNAGMGMNVSGTQGLNIEAAGTGAVRVNTGITWNGFTGPLNIVLGNLDPVAGNTLPMVRLTMGSGANWARLGMFNGRNQSIRGFVGTTNSYVGNNGSTPGTISTLTLGNNDENGDFAGIFGRNDANDTASNLFRSNIGIAKVGAGTQKFSGTSFAAGPTTINGGSFLMNGLHAATGTMAGNAAATTGTFGLYAVNNGGTLGGTGTIRPFDTNAAATPMMSVNDGGNINPGDGGIGTLTLDGSASVATMLNFAANVANGGGKVTFDLGAGSTSDMIALIGGQANDIVFNNNTLSFNALGGATSGDYTLFTADVAGAYSGLTTDGSGAIIAGLSIGTGLAAGSSLKVVGNNIVVSAVIGPAGVLGDYNGNGVVDAADYVLWRDGGPLQNDPTAGVQPEDYDFWRAHFGATSGSGSASGHALAAPVPEPTTLWIVVTSVVVLLAMWRCR